MTALTDKTYNILFLCTGNSARSVMAEALMNRLSKGRFHAYSAGSQPAGAINPLTLDLLKRQGFKTEDFRSKSWEVFAAPDAPAMDFVITVCDKAAGETCPVWPGQPMTAHWGFEDPVAALGNDEQRRRKFTTVFTEIARRIELMLALPIEQLDRLALERRVRDIGRT